MVLFLNRLSQKKAYQLRKTINISFCISLLLVIYILIKHTQIEWKSCPSISSENSSVIPPLQKANRSSYPAFIISAVTDRFNFTKSNLNTRLPGFFDVTHRKSVNATDPRIYGSFSFGAASLMLTYIDLWKEIALKPASELAENDWVFLFEDDVDIVPLGIIQGFYNKIYIEWSKTNETKGLTGTIIVR